MPTIEPNFNNEQHLPPFLRGESIHLTAQEKRTLRTVDHDFPKEFATCNVSFRDKRAEKNKKCGCQVSGVGCWGQNREP
jgi:hypothetical protein